MSLDKLLVMALDVAEPTWVETPDIPVTPEEVVQSTGVSATVVMIAVILVIVGVIAVFYFTDKIGKKKTDVEAASAPEKKEEPSADE